MAKKVSKPVDCRRCAHGYNFEHGLGYRCVKSETRFPWEHVASDPCDEFQPKPADSPPASADREGTDVLDVLREVRDVLLLSDPVGARAQAIAGLPEDPAVAALCKRWGYGAVMDSAARQWRRLDAMGAHTTGATPGTVQKTLAMVDAAISSEEARRARPAVQDQRDATIRDLRERLANVEPFEALHADLSEQIRAAWEAAGTGAKGLVTLADIIASDRERAAEDRAALQKCADVFAGLDRHYEGSIRNVRDALVSLRSAGVEPTPEAHEGKASR